MGSLRWVVHIQWLCVNSLRNYLECYCVDQAHLIVENEMLNIDRQTCKFIVWILPIGKEWYWVSERRDESIISSGSSPNNNDGTKSGCLG
jgi:hypothetical protein